MGFILLSLVAFSMPTRAADYNLGVAKDDEMISEIKSFDEDLADDYLGEDDIEDVIGKDAEVGAKKKEVVTKIEEVDDLTSKDDGKDCDGWEVDIDEWDWTTKDFKDDPDDDSTKNVYADPGDLGEDVSILSLPSIVGTDVAAYLDDVDWHKDVDQEGTTVTIEIDEDDAKAWYSKIDGDLILEYRYNSKGVIESTKFMDEDGNVIYEISLAGLIPGYELPLFLGITAIATIGIVYTIMKRK